jgi:hypothetical protein
MGFFLYHKIKTRNFLFAIDFYKFVFTKWIYRAGIYLLIAGSLFIITDTRAAFEKKEVGASSFAIGNAAVAIDDFIYAVYYNPAALSFSDKIQAAFTVQNYFGINDLNSIDLTTRFSVAGHPFSIAINRFGNPHYLEFQLSAGSQFELSKNCAVGVSAQWYILSIKKYSQDQAWGISFSILYSVTSKITLGALMTNVNRPTISEANEDLPQTMNMGLSYRPGNDLILSFEVFHDIRYLSEFRAGCSYQVLPAFTIRAGIEDQLDLYSYGFGINLNWISVDYALRTHSVLGLSHIATVTVTL